jgi:hypothetical protein
MKNLILFLSVIFLTVFVAVARGTPGGLIQNDKGVVTLSMSDNFAESSPVMVNDAVQVMVKKKEVVNVSNNTIITSTAIEENNSTNLLMSEELLTPGQQQNSNLSNCNQSGQPLNFAAKEDVSLKLPLSGNLVNNNIMQATHNTMKVFSRVTMPLKFPIN